MAQLEHESILPVYDFGRDGDALYIVMRLLSGGTLADRLKSRILSLRQAFFILRPVADALDFAHSRGVLHRDVKPSNIAFDDRDRPFLMDFGLAYLALSNSELTQTGVMMGTPTYMAPEQVNGEPSTPATDVYALGVVAFEMLAGSTPFSGDMPIPIMLAHLTEPPPSLTRLRSDLPPTVDNVFRRVLAKSPGERYATAREFVLDLWTSDPDATQPFWPANARTAIYTALPSPRSSVSPSVASPIEVIAVPSPIDKPGWLERLRHVIRTQFSPKEAKEVPRTQPLLPPTEPWLGPPGQVPGMETVIAGPSAAPSLLAKGMPSLILQPEVVDLLAPVGRNVISELLSHQEPERIVDYILNFGGGRFLVSGYGSFGGTSLTREICRSAWQSLAPQLRSSRRVLLIVRMSPRESLLGEARTWEVSIQHPPAEPVSMGQFSSPITPEHDGQPQVLELLDTLADLAGPRQARSALRGQLEQIIPTQTAVSHVILILDKILDPATLDPFLNHPFTANRHVSLLVVSEQEQLNRWPDGVLTRLKNRWNFQLWSVPCLWENEWQFVEKTMNRFVTGFRLDDPRAHAKFDAFKKHLAFVGRGQLGTTLYELRQNALRPTHPQPPGPLCG
jgi:serine/threonine protein kinase